ncbi:MULTISPECIES: hypothetical protein [Clostridium]|uniref:hypothetical protein n=1 Tax=Clostridium TaxID=1485 RepID=UPI00311A3B61
MIAERLRDAISHCYTSKGRHESVAELMAYFMKKSILDGLCQDNYTNHILRKK